MRPIDMQVLRKRAIVGVLALLAMSGCSPSGSGSAASDTRVHVSGRLEGVGGPAPGAPRPWRGTVVWTGPTHGSVVVAADGRFSLSLPPGRYELSGHSPRYGDGDYLCRAPHVLVVRAGSPEHLDVLCQMT